MAIEVKKLGPNTLEVDAIGILKKSDCEQIVPLIEQYIQNHGYVDLLVNISNFNGWRPSGVWREIEFDRSHFNSVTKFSLVAGDRSKKWMAMFARSFTTAKVGFFVQQDLESAREWIQKN